MDKVDFDVGEPGPRVPASLKVINALKVLVVVAAIGTIVYMFRTEANEQQYDGVKVFSSNWNKTADLMLEDCATKYAPPSDTKNAPPPFFNEQQTYAALVEYPDKFAIVYSGLPLPQNIIPETLPAPVALGPQILICYYERATLLLNDAYASRDATWKQLVSTTANDAVSFGR